MRVLVVFESFFGCTQTLAEAVAEGVRTTAPDVVVEVLRVDAAPTDLAGIDLLVVGGPTHLLGLSSRLSRWLQAQYWGDPVAPRRPRRPHGRPSGGPSLCDWLAGLPAGTTRVRAAAFDTRMPGPLTGGARRGIARRLEARGLVLVAAPAAFRVTAVGGPLRAGERSRAIAWGAALATTGAPLHRRTRTAGRRVRPGRSQIVGWCLAAG
jgi:hypothetical protein